MLRCDNELCFKYWDICTSTYGDEICGSDAFNISANCSSTFEIKLI